MVSGLSRPQRLLSIAVIGGVSLFAVTVYIIFRRKFKNKEANVEDMPELPKTNQVESEPIPDSDVVAADCSKDIDEASEASPSQIEAEEPSPRIQDLELKTEVADLKTEASISEKPSLTMQTLAEMQPIPDWAECSAEIEPIPPSPTVEKSDISTVQNQSVETVTNNTAEPSNIATIQDQPVETVSNRNAETIEPIVEKCENQVNKKSEAGVSSEVTTSKKSQAASKRTDRVSNNEKMPRNEEYRMYNGNHSAIFDSDQTVLPIYEFEVPNTLVGLIIGIRGKTIKELCTRADVRILIRPHHDPSKVTTHQICSIEGRRDDINKCLHMMRHRFPPNRFPDLNLKPVFPPPAPTPVYTSPDMMELALPVGAMFEVYISAPIDSGHFFVQLPTHPTFPSLRHVDELMNRIYNHSLELPDYVRPPKHAKNMLCAAPASNGWFRAVAVCYDEKQDEMLVKFVDYGGFARIPRADLRFLLRQDLLSLPFQSIECHIADVEPISGNWSEEANTYFQKLCTGKIINCELVGHSRKDGFPVVRLYVKNTKNEWVPFYKLLVKHRMAKPWDPNSYIPLQLPKITITKEHHDSDVDSVHSDTTLVSPEPSEEAKKENNVQKTDSYNHFNGAAAKNKNHQFGKKGGKSQKRDVTAAYR